MEILIPALLSPPGHPQRLGLFRLLMRRCSAFISQFQSADAPDYGFVFTRCNKTANEECPSWSGLPLRARRGLADLVAVDGHNAEMSRAVHQIYAVLNKRINAPTSLPRSALNRMSLRKAADDSGQIEEGLSL